jgi:hypothetical protein
MRRIAWKDDRSIPAQSSFVVILMTGKIEKRGLSATIERGEHFPRTTH